MTHIRRQIRDNVVAAVTGLPLVGGRVYKSRLYPLTAAQLPGLCVYTGDEQVSTSTISYPRTQERSVEVRVEVFVSAADGYDDTADAVIEQVEVAVSDDVTRGGVAKDTRLSAIRTTMTADGESPVVVAVMVYDVRYTAKENAPGGAV